MTLPTITLVNLTGSAITFRQLAVTLSAAPGTEVVSDFNRTEEILNDDQLQTELGAGNVRIDITGGGLSSSNTVKTLEQSKAIIKPIHDLDIKHNLAGIISPVATDDEDSGYSVGSIWVDEVADESFICVDATSTAAVWNPMGQGALDWAAVLTAGNISGGTDAVMSVGDSLRGVDATSGSAFDLSVRGGATTDTSPSTDGGDLLLTGGSTGSTSFVGSANGGHVRITGGGTSGTGSASGGGVFITGATPTNDSGTGGSITIAAGDGATGGDNALGGDVLITTGDGKNASFTAGDFSVLCGTSPTGSGAGGNITLTAGHNEGDEQTNTGGSITITTGTSLGGTGNLFLGTGDNLDTAVPGEENIIGSITIETGTVAGGSEDFTGGSITIRSQGDTSGGADSVIGGSVSISAGNTGFTDSNGGDIDLTAGNCFGFNTRFGGTITLTCGTESGGNTDSEGGSVVMVPGTSVSGHDGMVKVDGTGTIQMLERSVVVTGITGGEGRWWVRDDGPNVPMFTDDDGGDWVLNETGAADLQEAYEGGSTILVSAGEGGPVAISGTPDDASTLLTLTGGNHTVPTAGSLLTLTTDALSNGAAMIIDNIGGGRSLVVQDNGTNNLIISGTGAVLFTPTFNEDFTVDTSGVGSISLDAPASSNFSVTGGNLLLSGLSLNITALAAIAPGDIVVTGSTAAGLGNDGGDITATAGGGAATGAGGQVSFKAGTGGLTGTGGKASLTGGLGGGTSGNGGVAAVAGGAPTDGDGGLASLTGAAGVGTNRSGGVVLIDAGDSTGSANGAAVSITAGDGSVSSVGGAVNITGGDGRTGGDVVITSGGPFGLLSSGNVRIVANGTGDPGQIFLITESDDLTSAPVTTNTQSGFADQGENRRTFGRSELIGASTSSQAVVNLASIVSNGDQMRVEVKLTSVHATLPANTLSFRFNGDFYRDAGTVFAGGVFQNANIGTGLFAGGVAFSVAINGSTIELHLSNTDLLPYTFLISATFITQKGGAAA